MSFTASAVHGSQPWRVTKRSSGKNQQISSRNSTCCGANGIRGPGTPTVDATKVAMYDAQFSVVEHPDIGAIVLECTNMPPYTLDIQRATGRPVFDVVSLVRMVHASLVAGLAPRSV